MITAQTLADATGIPLPRANAWFIPVNNALHKFEINTPKRIAAFLAQVGEESAMFTAVEENLNYSANALSVYFHAHFNEQQAQAYAHNPVAIASRAYANRFGNGDEASQDGWKYRGRGLIQITFKDNYAACGKALGLDLVTCPELLTHPNEAALSAGWYWQSHGCNELADVGNMHDITVRINGGLNGYAERMEIYNRALPILEKHL